jgi:hypothetical protein
LQTFRIKLDTFRAPHEHEHKLAAYCATCERWAALDLERLIAEGRGEFRLIGWKARCRYCRGPGELQVRPAALKSGVGGRPYIDIKGIDHVSVTGPLGDKWTSDHHAPLRGVLKARLLISHEHTDEQ